MKGFTKKMILIHISHLSLNSRHSAMDVMSAVSSQSCLDLSTELDTQQAIQVSGSAQCSS